MVSFTTHEAFCLRIVAMNRPDKELHPFLFRTVLALLNGEAHLAGIMMLGLSQVKIDEVAKRFSAERVQAVRKYCDDLIAEANSELSALEVRVLRPRTVLFPGSVLLPTG